MMRVCSFRIALAGSLLSLPAATRLAGQTGTIEGKVTSVTTAEPIVGAEVSLVGITIGTRTRPGGTFTLLNVPAGPCELRVLAIGFKVATAQLVVLPDQTTTTTLQLAPSVLQLDAIIVTGTPGQARVREVGNSIVQVNLSQVKDPPASMDQLLQARAPGLSVMQTSGMAGEGAQIRLRGAVSVSQSNQPIIYVDGVRVRSEGYRRNRPPFNDSNGFRGGNYQASPLNDINPADVERVEIIKGAAASTLYGTEAAAGVIQIFTKHGLAGVPRWTVQVGQGFSQLRPFGTDSVPYLNLRPAGHVHGLCHETPVTGCSWIRNAYRQHYSGSVSGGSAGANGLQYFLSATSEDNDGVLPLDNEKKLSTRGNVGITLADNLRIEWNTAYSNTDLSNTPAGNNAHGLVLNVYRGERNYRSSSDPKVIDSLLNQSLTTGIQRLITGATVTYTPFAGFSNRFTLGYDLAQQQNHNLRPFGFVAAPQGILVDEQLRYSLLTADYVGSMDLRLSPQLASTFSVGGQAVTSEEGRATAYGEGFPGPGVPVVSAARVQLAGDTSVRVINAGFFLQNVFKFRDRYFLTGGVRFDGNSAFGRSLGLQVYPKISGSYVISDEPFWPASWGEVKLRGALGWSGRAPGAFDAVRSWRPCISAAQSCFLPGQVGDTLVGPERTREAELGFDAALVKNRVTVEATWYHRLTNDELFAIRQIPSEGWPFQQRSNVGSMSNTGFEVSLDAIVVNKPNWGIDIGGTVYTNHGIVRDLGGAVPFAAGGGWVQVGFAPITARERKECVPANTNADTFWFPQDFWKLRDVTLTIPVGWAIHRATSATLIITAQNYLKWVNDQLRLFDPEMVGRDALDSQNRDISEQIPPPAVITVNLRVTF